MVTDVWKDYFDFMFSDKQPKKGREASTFRLFDPVGRYYDPSKRRYSVTFQKKWVFKKEYSNVEKNCSFNIQLIQNSHSG
jgi:hypothetical protein